MEVYLIRHTTPKIAKGICYGQSDLPLADTFAQEAEAIKSQLGSLNSGALVFSSPLQRCALLSDAIFEEQAHRDSRLMELDFGDWEMKAWNELPEEELNPWMEDFVHIPCPNGESYMDLYQRCIDFLEEVKQYDAGQVVVVCHAGPIRAMHAHVHEIALKDSFSLKVDYGEVIKLEL
ncbi:alpha-ribazole phosphatase [Echinicola sediminis]